MTYQETLDFLFSQVPMFQNLGAGAYKPGLATTLAIADAFGNPHKELKAAIHIAGTNGKGSTAHTIAAVLQAAGYRTGLYTSPHLLDFRERIRVDGRPVDEKYVCDFVARFIADDALTALHPTFFELTTIMAFRYFADRDVDVAVIETGLGGRLDCTNIIMPELSIITNISLDHTALLGHTPEAIAHEKAGIIKPGVPVVIGRAEADVREVFTAKAAECGSHIEFASDNPLYTSATPQNDTIRYTGTPWGDINGELSGECQTENAATILAALKILEKRFEHINARAVAQGFANVCAMTGLAGRWMTVETAPVRVICDTGHNPGGWEHLGKTLQQLADTGALHLVLGFVNDKDLGTITEFMPRNARYYFATPSVARGRDARDTAAMAAEHGIAGDACGSVADAYKAARTAAKDGDTIFVGGSTFVVADFLAFKKEGRE